MTKPFRMSFPEHLDWQQLKAGNFGSFSKVYQALYPTLIQDAASLLTDRAQANNVVFESFLISWKKALHFPSSEYFVGYLTYTVRRQCLVLNAGRHQEKVHPATALPDSINQ